MIFFFNVFTLGLLRHCQQQEGLIDIDINRQLLNRQGLYLRMAAS